ncbi:hypothetical protein KP509_36G024800 [Ceratopteris richardii]|uniref:GUN4-like domain-containing protein n=1 Tax=Ceratopteris richardii TaxID=49495 RepID=A0A8T2QCS6_CERRI|nr:hypothetical protein KP509_36G024800 [Ceratopteris richardii]
MPIADLQTIDRLWCTHNNGKFGYSVQRKIMNRVDGDCTAFFKKVGWMKPLESNAFPSVDCSAVMVSFVPCLGRW